MLTWKAGSNPAHWPYLKEGKMIRLPKGYNDGIYVDTDIHLSFWDRVKVLFGWKFSLNSVIYCENQPGKVFSESKVSIWRRWWWKKPVGFIHEEKQPK